MLLIAVDPFLCCPDLALFHRQAGRANRRPGEATGLVFMFTDCWRRRRMNTEREPENPDKLGCTSNWTYNGVQRARLQTPGRELV